MGIFQAGVDLKNTSLLYSFSKNPGLHMDNVEYDTFDTENSPSQGIVFATSMTVGGRVYENEMKDKLQASLLWLVNLPHFPPEIRPYPLVSLNKALLNPYFWGG